MHCKPLMYAMYVYALQSHVVLFTTPMICYLQTIGTNRHLKVQECLVVCVANQRVFQLKCGHEGKYTVVVFMKVNSLKTV